MSKSKNRAGKKRLGLIRSFLEETEWSTVKKYVELLRERGQLLEVGRVDVDAPQIVERRFTCDALRCIQWAGDKALVDRSCCCRYGVPVTQRDRALVRQRLEQVRKNLPKDHRLQDPGAEVFEVDDDYGFNMINDNPLEGCQFNLYQGGTARCAIHQTALEQGEDPCGWKPIACSLWPMAINSHDDGGEERFLLTIYCDKTEDLFDAVEDEPFACIVHQDPSFPRLYESEGQILKYLFGAKWYGKLDAAAKRWLSRIDS